jgi:hypothetical protein
MHSLVSYVLHWLQNNTIHADYNTTVNSWLEQRSYITGAPRLLQKSHPKLAASIEKALLELETVTPASTTGYTPLNASALEQQEFSCAGMSLGFNGHGALVKLSQPLSTPIGNTGNTGTLKEQHAAVGAMGAMEWANSTRPIGSLVYQTFTNKDYNIFLQDFAARLGDWEHGKHDGCWYEPDDEVSGLRVQ